jgi:anti-sigma regulatory factor (Ser/Thr protein kinase)
MVSWMTRHRLARRIRSDADVVHAVVAATDFARRMQFKEPECRALGTIVSELGTNIIKYAGHGSVTVEEVESGGRVGVQVTVSDRGPGIEDVQQALEEHFSSSGTLGLGLPGVRRMMDDFKIESQVGHGTTVRVRKWIHGSADAPKRRGLFSGAPGGDAFAERGTERKAVRFEDPTGSQPPLEVAHVNRPCRGELVSGDAVSVTEADGGVLIGVIDGLGHGRDANLAAKTAARFLRKEGSSDLGHLMSRLNDRLRGTVGAAVGLCWIDLTRGRLLYAAVGNTVMRIEGEGNTHIQAVAGTVGLNFKPPRIGSAQLRGDDVLLLYTDGVSDRASIKDYPQLRYQAASTVADTMITRYGKRHDDATCVACRYAAR